MALTKSEDLSPEAKILASLPDGPPETAGVGKVADLRKPAVWAAAKGWNKTQFQLALSRSMKIDRDYSEAEIDWFVQFQPSDYRPDMTVPE